MKTIKIKADKTDNQRDGLATLIHMTFKQPEYKSLENALYSITSKVEAFLIDIREVAICNAIITECQKNDISDLYLLDKEWTLSALYEKVEREHDNISIKLIADHFGQAPQTIKAIEEMSELTAELTRELNSKDRRKQVLEELVDVKIMLEQLTYLYSFTDKELKQMETHKINRTKERIKNKNG